MIPSLSDAMTSTAPGRAVGRILFVCHTIDLLRVSRLCEEFRRRRFAVDSTVFNVRLAQARYWPAATTHVIAILPQIAQAATEEVLIREFGRHDITLVLSEGVKASNELLDIAYQVVADSGTGVDRLFLELFRAVTGPWPAWLEARFATAEVIQPTGVAWWSDDLLVVDASKQHLMQIGSDGSVQLVLGGLSEPHHVMLDRHQLLLANAGEDSVIAARLVQGRAAEIRDITVAGVRPSELNRPHCAVMQGGTIAIADTDNNRILVGEEGSCWRSVDSAGGRPFRFPCGVLLDPHHLWVANSDDGNLDVFDFPNLVHRLRFNDKRLIDPVGLARWRDALFVADEQSKSLLVYRIESDNEGGVTGLSFAEELAIHQVRSPFGLSVNRAHDLAISDRDLGCIWILRLPDSPLGGN